MKESGGEIQLHATAIVLGTAGFLVTGRSGSGKSAIALRLLAGAAQAGEFSRLVGDDQLFLRPCNGRVVVRAPEAIAGRIECRGSGIASLPSLRQAVLDHALAPAVASGADRIPPEGERYRPGHGIDLPILRLRYDDPAPFATLAVLLRRMGTGS